MYLPSFLALFSPLLGFLCVGLFMGRISSNWAQGITCVLMGVANVATLLIIESVCFNGETWSVSLLPFITLGNTSIAWGIHLDSLSAIMIGVVNFISLMVHVYSIGYMHGDKSIPRFMAYLSFFTFCMLLLLTAPNLVQLFVGWEGVGVASYLLIGYYYERESANQASMKAFLVNRVGDVGMIIALFMTFLLFGSLDFPVIFEGIPQALGHTTPLPFFGEVGTISLICSLFFIGAMGKSAQLGLHVWLPDAMEGPTPVSALIHAATMVTAGVFLLVRLSPLLIHAPDVQNVILLIGAITSFFAATVACTQTDIKRVIAYSTCSQLGFMFMAVGVSAFGPAMFHLATHAFFKALLFLGAGSVIHAMSGGQELDEMGGLYRLIPLTYGIMWIGSLALAGIPFFAGYYSKEAILEAVSQSHALSSPIAMALALLSVFLTAFYSWRLLCLAFHGESRANSTVYGRVHESPPVMLFPLFILAFGAIFAGYVGAPFFIGSTPIWGDVIAQAPSHPAAAHDDGLMAYLPIILAVTGAALGTLLYQSFKSLPERMSQKYPAFYHFFLRKWYFDELYQKFLVTPLWTFSGFLWQKGDVHGIDAFGPGSATRVVNKLSCWVSKAQTGYLYHYAFAMLLGIFSGIVLLMTHFYF